MSAEISYDVAAELVKWSSQQDRVQRNAEMVHSHAVYSGTLGGCIREFMLKPESQRPLYEIFTEKQDGVRPILDALDMAELAKREDYPHK